MSRAMNKAVIVVSALLLLTFGGGGGYWWAKRDAGMQADMASSGASVQARQALYWYDPMMPEQHFDKPGKSPFMDMQLVPKYADDTGTAGVRIDPGVQQNVGIRTARVESGRLTSRIQVPATLGWDLRQESIISARVDGIVSRLHVKAPFEPVHRGQTLATVLAPAWASAIAEAEALRHTQSSSAKDLQSAANQRLRMLGLSGTHIGRDGSVVLLSPSDGVVSDVLVREGQTVMAGMPLFRVNSTATLWLEAAIPQGSLGGIRRGTKVEATVSALPGRMFDGEVETLLPEIDPVSRAQRARIVLRNEDGLLVPGMFAELVFQFEASDAVPLVPTEAIVATGSDTRVIVVRPEGGFEPVQVRLGRSSGGRTEILSGLNGGEHVVVSGQFLIDSEASLSGALERLDASKPDGMKEQP